MPKQTVGWVEWVGLPQLGIKKMRAKIDSGAKTSSLHAFDLRPMQNGERIQFKTFLAKRTGEKAVRCEAPVAAYKLVTTSSGHREYRYVIRTAVMLGDTTRQVRITLADRSSMQYKLLLGRSFLRKRFLIDPAHKNLLGMPS